MENPNSPVPKWYWIVAVLALLWNLMGVSSFFQQILISDETLQAMTAAERELYESYPLWSYALFAIAVFGGFFGSLGLLLRKTWAKKAFAVSLVAILPQMAFNLFFTNAREVYGPGTEIMPIMIILVGILLLWFAVRAARNGWLR